MREKERMVDKNRKTGIKREKIKENGGKKR